MGRHLRQYGFGLLASTVMFAGLATIATGLLTIGQSVWPEVLRHDGGRTIVVGLGMAAAACAVLGLPLRRYGRADGAVPSAYGELRAMLDCLQARFEPYRATPPEDAGARSAAAEVAKNLEVAEAELGEPPTVGLRWLLANGYIDLWKRLHKAEEALLQLEPTEHVVGRALHDRLRLKNSTIPSAPALSSQIALAVGTLSKSGPTYIQATQTGPTPETATNGPGNDPNGGGGGAGEAEAEPAGATTAPLDTTYLQLEARSVLRQVSAAVDEFRDDRRSALVRGRNNLFTTVVFTGLTAYVLLAIAIVQDATPGQIAAGATFYLVGALVGLFKQLRDASAADTQLEEDYGLATARLIHTPLFSGLAAIGGVVAATLLATVIPTPSNATITSSPAKPAKSKTPTPTPPPPPTPTPAPDPTPTPPPPSPNPAPSPTDDEDTQVRRPEVVPLRRIFDLGENPAGIIIAAIFGLTPNLLIIRLQRQVEQYKSELKSSSPAEARPRV